MTFLVTLATILAYLAAPPLGLALVVAVILFVALKRGRSKLEKLLTMLLITMPLYMLPIIPGLHHIASWTTVLSVFLIFLTARNLRRMSPTILVVLFVVTVFSVLTGTSTADGVDGLYYLAQFLLFVIPPALMYEARDWTRTQLDAEAINRLLGVLASVQLALAVGVLIQWQLHSRFSVTIGSISLFYERITYDLTISAYSVLSGLLSVGIVLAPILWRRGRWKMGILLGVASGAAIVVNSSRTGLVIGIVVLGLSFLFPPKGARRFGARLAIIPAGFLAWWMYDAYAASSRGAISSNLLDDNGRFETFDHAFSQLFRNDVTAALGLGYAEYQGVPPHNFVIETMASSGLIVAACVFLLIIGLLVYVRGTEWQFPLWALLGSSMLFSGFYAVKGATVIVVLMIAFRAAESAVNTENPQARPPVKVGKPGGSHLYVPLQAHGAKRRTSRR